jgi:hypothetical protein
MDWFRAAAMQIQVTNPEVAQRYLVGRKNIARIMPITSMDQRYTGRMVMFKYDAKTKDKLPYWDSFPLVLPLRFIRDKESSGFLGLNLHYLPPTLRAKLMDSIYTIYQDRQLDEGRKLNLSYDILNNSARHRWFKPCVKRYLYSHIRSRFNLVDPAEWDFVMMLPLAKWQKASEGKVYADSIRKIRG